MAQWWEQSPPTNVARVRFPDMWVEFVVGSLLCSERFFFGYSGFPFSLKTNISKFRFDPGMHGHFWTSSCELLGAPWVNKLHLHFFKNLFQLFTLKGTAKFPLPTFWEWTPWDTKTSFLTPFKGTTSIAILFIWEHSLKLLVICLSTDWENCTTR